ncbi:MAG: hypothetical protein RLZZ253_3252 [Verrucomicrobiota bacterium]
MGEIARQSLRPLTLLTLDPKLIRGKALKGIPLILLRTLRPSIPTGRGRFSRRRFPARNALRFAPKAVQSLHCQIGLHGCRIFSGPCGNHSPKDHWMDCTVAYGSLSCADPGGPADGSGLVGAAAAVVGCRSGLITSRGIQPIPRPDTDHWHRGSVDVLEAETDPNLRESGAFYRPAIGRKRKFGGR